MDTYDDDDQSYASDDDPDDEQVSVAIAHLERQFPARPMFCFDEAEVYHLRRQCECLWLACVVLLFGFLWVVAGR